MSDSERTLDDLVSELRDLVNSDRVRGELAPRWNQICSCMDAIGDAEWALAAHARLANQETGDEGMFYLAHFGFLQALFLQQDAVVQLCSALGMVDLGDTVKLDLREVRETRNDIAHMTDRERGRRFVGIVRISMTSREFTTYSFGSGGMNESVVSCAALSRQQFRCLFGVLEAAVTRLRDRERAHREKFRSISLQRIFHGADYCLQKLHAGVGTEVTPNDRSFAGGSLDSLQRMVREFGEAAAARGEGRESNQYVAHALEATEQALLRMREMLESHPDSIDAVAMATLVDSRLRRVLELASAVDRTYAQDPNED